MRKQIALAVLAAVLAAGTILAQTPQQDPFIWLEADSPRAMSWVRQQNAATLPVLEKVPEYAPIHRQLLKIFGSKARIPYPRIRDRYVYNFWQDTTHVRGLWRRTTLASYRTAHPAWTTVIDVDALAKKEGKDWVWKGATCLAPEDRLCMVALSAGGKDAVVWREFDTRRKAFVPGGFKLPEAKSDVSWKDANTLWVGTNFGKGSLTTSGYPRIVKEWKRGTPLGAAHTVLEGSVKDVSDSVYSEHTPEGRYDIATKSHTFFSGESFLILGGRLVKLQIPDDAQLDGFFKDQMLFSLRSKWTVGGHTYPQGALLAIDLDSFLAGNRQFKTLFTPTEKTSLDSVSWTRNHLLLTVLDNVHSRLYSMSLEKGEWSRREIPLPGIGTAQVITTSDLDDTFFSTYTDFLTPTTLYLSVDGAAPEKIKSSPAFFNATGMRVAQYEATSKDGTKIPYFVVMPKGFEANGKNPTVLYGYGGFEVSLLPHYSAVVGTAWLARGGVYVLANIRGGGEFGPRWHRAALKKNRHKAFEDFIAVAEDLIARKITSPRHLGIMGGSNGGLLVGASFTMRPGLFRAVVCQVPLLDMRRYTKIGAGASWIAEYGNPDNPGDWAYMKTWSPYQNVRKGVHYPRVFFYTSTADDRVGPAHARKMAAKMEAMGDPVYFYENTEGGHSAGANLKQSAHMWALSYAYLWKMLR
ncbi:MAG: S9 family peptidase [Acidobacteria bacterium]|nr:S9 family peptidase [Acidobacteriota bacterium]